MASPTDDASHSLAELVSYLFTRRDAILHNWRTACEQDPTLSKVSVLTREEFNNLLPLILNILEQRLMNKPEVADAMLTATSHGLHRWQKAHALPETMRELHHLTQTLYHQLQVFQDLFPQTPAKLLFQVHGQITEIMSQTLDGSVQKYDELQRLEAASRAASLQQALDQMVEQSRQRGDILRTSSHDLKGSFGIINSAAYLLKMEGLTEPEREQYLDMLSRNLTSVQSLLGSLMDLSRLEAGAEVLHIESFDASYVLNEIVASAQPMAAERGLVLQANGPDSLQIQTDKLKLQRIVQNLLLNALKYTPAGFVSVSWSQEGDMRWVLSVQDSGPGLSNALTTLLVRQLKPTVEPTASTGPDQAEPVTVLPNGDDEIPSGPALAQRVGYPSHGEGVGLHIVKRLSDLLDANLEIETHPDRGTLFRLRLPIRWQGNNRS